MPRTIQRLNHTHSHASRYFEIYLPSGIIEITHTSRYTHKTGKSELCMLATRPLAVGTIVTELKGSMADLTPEEERKLKHADPHSAGFGIRRDFSVIHSRQKKMNHLFLGPARFVNVRSSIISGTRTYSFPHIARLQEQRRALP